MIYQTYIAFLNYICVKDIALHNIHPRCGIQTEQLVILSIIHQLACPLLPISSCHDTG